MSVFVDTSAVYALLVETEEGHRAVVRSFEQLLRKGRSLFTTNYVVVESAALLQHRFGLAPVRDLVDRLLPVVTVRWVPCKYGPVPCNIANGLQQMRLARGICTP